MKQYFILLFVLMSFLCCTKNKAAKTEIPVVPMDGNRSVLVGEWEWEYSNCWTYRIVNGQQSLGSYATIDSGKFVLTHHITITPQADVIGTVNGAEVFRYKLNSVNFELDELPESFLGSYYCDATDNNLSMGISENKGTHLKIVHNLLPFPSGSCYNNYQAEYHVLRKL